MDTGIVLEKNLDPVIQLLNYSPGQYTRYAVYGSVYQRYAPKYAAPMCYVSSIHKKSALREPKKK